MRDEPFRKERRSLWQASAERSKRVSWTEFNEKRLWKKPEEQK